MSEAETICAVATPPGEGALGIVRVSGPGSLELLRAASRRRRFPPRRLRLCRLFGRDGEPLDQVLACFQPGPASYTGEDSVELYAHGGVLNLQRLLARLVELGARAAAPGEFTRRAFLNGRLDLTQAEAVAAIIGARSERALTNAQRLHSGALRASLAAVRESLLELAAELETALEFSEEVPAHELGASSAQAEAALRRLLASYQAGRRLDGARVAIVGAANAGKSSLFNRLLDRERALVAAEPGTTRDYLEAEVVLEGLRLTLVDAAGLRPAGGLEQAGQALAEPVLAGSDLLLHLRPLDTGELAPLPASLRSLPCLEVGSKADLAKVGYRPALCTSARTGEGLQALRDAIVERLLPGEAAEETVLVTEERQALELVRASEELAALRRCLAGGCPPELAAEHLRLALRALAELTGEVSTEEVLDTIFRRFCIGK
jgi:tRNA modification GTPase